MTKKTKKIMVSMITIGHMYVVPSLMAMDDIVMDGVAQDQGMKITTFLTLPGHVLESDHEGSVNADGPITHIAGHLQHEDSSTSTTDLSLSEQSPSEASTADTARSKGGLLVRLKESISCCFPWLGVQRERIIMVEGNFEKSGSEENVKRVAKSCWNGRFGK